jgi:hypothetical protein
LAEKCGVRFQFCHAKKSISRWIEQTSLRGTGLLDLMS